MNKTVTPVPEGHRTIAPCLVVKSAEAALAFYRAAFGAAELMCIRDSEGRVMHAEIQIGDSRLMLMEECPEMQILSPESLGGTPVSIHLYVPDADGLFRQATDAGASVVAPPKDQIHGDRCGSVRDPFGHLWQIATHQEDVPLDELQARFETLCFTY